MFFCTDSTSVEVERGISLHQSIYFHLGNKHLLAKNLSVTPQLLGPESVSECLKTTLRRPIPPRSLWATLIGPTPTWNSDPPEPRILDRTLLPEVMLQPHAYLGDTLRGFNTKIGSRNREWLPGIYILHRCMLGVVQLRGMCRTCQQLVQQLHWFVECMVS